MNRSTIHQRITHVLAATGIAALAGSSIVMATSPAKQHDEGLDKQPHQWMQTGDRDRTRDRDRDRDRDRYDHRDKTRDAAHKVEAKAIDVRKITTADDLLGADLYSTATNEQIGSAHDLIISTNSGDIKWLIVNKGLVLRDLVAIQIDQVTWDHERERFTTSITEERLDRLPSFEADEWANLRHDTWYGALRDFVIGDERETLGVVRHVRARDIMGQPLLADQHTRIDPAGHIDDHDNGSEVDRTKVADVQDIVIAMDIMRAPIVIARTGGLLQESIDRAVPINAVRWDRRDPVLINVTDTQFEAMAGLPEDFPNGINQPTHIVQSFQFFRVPALVKADDATPRTPREGERPQRPEQPERPRW